MEFLVMSEHCAEGLLYCSLNTHCIYCLVYILFFPNCTSSWSFEAQRPILNHLLCTRALEEAILIIWQVQMNHEDIEHWLKSQGFAKRLLQTGFDFWQVLTREVVVILIFSLHGFSCRVVLMGGVADLDELSNYHMQVNLCHIFPEL